jgi:hypothetical protein
MNTMRKFNADVWGPHYWFFLHTVAYSYPDTPNTITKRKYYDLIQNIPLFIPTPEIGNEFSKLLDKYPVSPYLDNRDSFIRWVHFMHNKINVILGKEEISLMEANDRYKAKYIPKPVLLSEKLRIKKYHIYITLTLIFLFLIYIYSDR